MWKSRLFLWQLQEYQAHNVKIATPSSKKPQETHKAH
jgi:hypothetical protein